MQGKEVGSGIFCEKGLPREAEEPFAPKLRTGCSYAQDKPFVPKLRTGCNYAQDRLREAKPRATGPSLVLRINVNLARTGFEKIYKLIYRESSAAAADQAIREII